MSCIISWKKIIPYHIIFHIIWCHVISHHIMYRKNTSSRKSDCINLLDLELSLKPILYYKIIYIYIYICALSFCAAELLTSNWHMVFGVYLKCRNPAWPKRDESFVFWRFVAWDEISVTYGFCLSNIWFSFFFGMRLHFFVAWCHAQRLGFPDQKTGALLIS